MLKLAPSAPIGSVEAGAMYAAFIRKIICNDTDISMVVTKLPSTLPAQASA